MLMKINAFLLTMMVSLAGMAQSELQVVSDLFSQRLQMAAEATRGLNWKVGDTANYNISAGFVKGTMKMMVRERAPEGIWAQQDLDLGFAGKQKVETLFDADTGEVKKVLVNGKEEQTPIQDSEVVEVTESKVTVPAGSFNCLYVITKDSEGKLSKSWVNPNIIPIVGLIKVQSPSQYGEVNVELTSFKKQ